MNSLILLALTSFSLSAQPPIVLYDLTPTLQIDTGNPAQVADAWDHAHAVAAIQGIVNRSEPLLYIRFVHAFGRNVDEHWLAKFQEPGGWLAGRKTEQVPNLQALVKRFRKSINLASTIAGVENLLPVRYDPRPGSLYSTLVTGGPKLRVVRRLLKDDNTPLFTGRGTIPGTQLESTGSAKCDAYLWMKVHYIDTGKVDAGFAGYYLDAYWQKRPTASGLNQHTLTNHDYFISKRAFFFDLGVWGDETPVDDPNQPLGADLRTLKELLLSAYKQAGKERMIHVGGFTPWTFKYTNHPGAGSKHEPVPTEWEFSRVVSAYNGFVDADAIGLAAMANASFFTHFPLKDRYPQPWTTREQLVKRGLLTRDGQVRVDDREFIIFYVGDYDAAAWVYQAMPSLWDHPARGKIPLMWSISPVLERRAAPMLDYLRRTATPNDYFAAADNGAGYLNPGMLQEPRGVSGLPSGLDAWARHCEPFYRRWDLTITGFIIDGYAPGLTPAGLDCYASFSPNGIVPQKIPMTLLHGDMPVLRADHDLPDDPEKAVGVVLQRTELRRVPFTWFRAILKSPDWYMRVLEGARAKNPRIELLDAPAFFELYRIWLKNTPDAAAGKFE
jgi:hypothetical protein